MDGYALLFAVMGVVILMLGMYTLRLLSALKVLCEGLYAVADGEAIVRRTPEGAIKFYPKGE
jgi:hypothetical protein